MARPTPPAARVLYRSAHVGCSPRFLTLSHSADGISGGVPDVEGLRGLGFRVQGLGFKYLVCHVSPTPRRTPSAQAPAAPSPRLDGAAARNAGRPALQRPLHLGLQRRRSQSKERQRQRRRQVAVRKSRPAQAATRHAWWRWFPTDPLSAAVTKGSGLQGLELTVSCSAKTHKLYRRALL